MQYAVTPSLLWCYRLFYSKIPEVVSVLFSKKKVSFVCTKGRNTQKKLSLRKTCGRFPECFLGGGGAEKTQRDELEDDMHITCFVSLCGAEHSTPRTTIPKREVSSLHTRNCKDGPQLCRRCVHDRTQQLINPRFPQTVKPPGRPESQQHIAVSLVTVCVRLLPPLLLLGHQHPSVEVASPSY